MTDIDNFLEHHGIKGQKWGVRTKRKPQLGPSKDSKRASAAQRKVKRGSVKSLTNQELKDLNNRIDLERKYNSINPGKLKKGHKVATTVLATGATINTAIAFAKSPAGQAIGKKLAKKSTS